MTKRQLCELCAKHGGQMPLIIAELNYGDIDDPRFQEVVKALKENIDDEDKIGEFMDIIDEYAEELGI